MKRTASALWQGGFKNGRGMLSTESNTLKDMPYSFSARFENGTGTNPEELIAAAHAGCFAMALSMILDGNGFTAERLAVQATATLEQVQGRWAITTIALDLNARIPGIERAKFEALAQDAKKNCPVSRVLNASISINATLQG